jgi:hypothetical protein
MSYVSSAPLRWDGTLRREDAKTKPEFDSSNLMFISGITRRNLKMLKSKNEATKLLKTQGRAWVRLQNEPIFFAEFCYQRR